jgi:hypothetical protein
MNAGMPQEDFCGVRNTSFVAGEQINFNVFYAVAGLYVNAGSATFSNSLLRLNGRPVYHIVGLGATHPSYDWIYKVRDRYESFVDTATMQPLKFIRNVQEGDHKEYDNVTFNRTANTATSNKGTFKVPACVQDVLSSIYYARNINFNKYKPGDRTSTNTNPATAYHFPCF